MALSEFELIRRYFARGAVRRAEVVVGIGDDAAVLALPERVSGLTAQATLAAGEAGRWSDHPRALGHRALAKALHKLAASGATPAWATLSLSIPSADPAWLEAFSSGFGDLAARYRVQLIGGDTTRGPLRISIAVEGLIETDARVAREPRTGDFLYLTGSVGSGAEVAFPEPLVDVGRMVSSLASAATDIGEGLTTSIATLLGPFELGAILWSGQLPLRPEARAISDPLRTLDGFRDDLQLCFSVRQDRADRLLDALAERQARATRIGVLTPAPGILLEAR